jgi:hypothetical protein
MIFDSDILEQFGDKYKNIIQFIIDLCQHTENWMEIIYKNPLSLCSKYIIK